MRSVIILLSVAALTPALVRAQSSHGYVFVAPGGLSGGGTTESTLHGGLGFEAMVWRQWVGAGAEGGWVGPIRQLGSGVGTVSPNGYVHFGGDRLRGLDPFATAGYSMFFRRDTRSLFNFGAGLNWWFRDNTGLKFEIRDHIDSAGRTTAHFWGFRFGVTFR